jgi:hypothetical protein
VQGGTERGGLGGLLVGVAALFRGPGLDLREVCVLGRCPGWWCGGQPGVCQVNTHDGLREEGSAMPRWGSPLVRLLAPPDRDAADPYLGQKDAYPHR